MPPTPPRRVASLLAARPLLAALAVVAIAAACAANPSVRVRPGPTAERPP
ncbi:MAG: hypothetical protein JNM10_09905, partial [Planctomycetia bacterium]|nr:hypothetical protein [Planctomycetia bacterium]